MMKIFNYAFGLKSLYNMCKMSKPEIILITFDFRLNKTINYVSIWNGQYLKLFILTCLKINWYQCTFKYNLSTYNRYTGQGVHSRPGEKYQSVEQIRSCDWLFLNFGYCKLLLNFSPAVQLCSWPMKLSNIVSWYDTFDSACCFHPVYSFVLLE